MKFLLFLILLVNGAYLLQAADDITITAFKNDCRAAVSFTFDDGHLTHVTDTAPAFERYGFRATWYPVVGWTPQTVDPSKKKPKVSWEQWRVLAAKGHEIGNHSMTHLNLKKVTDTATLQREIDDAFDRMTTAIGQSPLSFAYAFCQFNDTVVKRVAEKHIVHRGYFPLYEKSFPTDKAIAASKKAIADKKWHV